MHNVGSMLYVVVTACWWSVACSQRDVAYVNHPFLFLLAVCVCVVAVEAQSVESVQSHRVAVRVADSSAMF